MRIIKPFGFFDLRVVLGRRRLAILLFVLCCGSFLFSGVSTNAALAQEDSGDTTVHVIAWGETLYAIASRYNVSVESIMTANDLSNADRIYAGLTLVIPGATSAAPSSSTVSHIVQQGETLYRISLQYGVSMDAIEAANGLSSPEALFAGQSLIIPGQDGTQETSTEETASPAVGTYTVERGDTLSEISRKFGVSISSLVTANALLNPSTIYAGQQLAIPGGATATTSGYTPDLSSQTHTVVAGETLTRIAAQYGVSAWILAQVNNISNPSLLYAGQLLTIPSDSAVTTEPSLAASASKHIVVDVSDQRAYVYENGTLLWTFVVSTGLPGADTWRGEFQIQNKIPNAYASTWNLQMPYWLGFYWAGSLQNGFHALPILSSGTRLWEGLLGRPASYGCVILSDNDARLLYEWAEVGTAVTVRN